MPRRKHTDHEEANVQWIDARIPTVPLTEDNPMLPTKLDAAGRDAYVEKLTPLAYSLANKFFAQWRGAKCLNLLDEFISAAFFGLARAAAKFNPALGYQPTTYAHYAIERSCFELIHQLRSGGLGGCQSGHARAPIPAVGQFDQLESCGYEAMLVDGRENYDSSYHRENRAEVERLLSHLEDRDRRVIQLRYLEGRTLEECGQELGVSKERIRQLCGAILARLRELRPMEAAA